MPRISPSASSACELLNSVSKVNSQVLTKCFRISGASSANLRKSTNQDASFCRKTVGNVGVFLKSESHLNCVQFSGVPQHASCRPGRVRLGFLKRSLLLLHFGNGLFICTGCTGGQRRQPALYFNAVCHNECISKLDEAFFPPIIFFCSSRGIDSVALPPELDLAWAGQCQYLILLCLSSSEQTINSCI